MSLADEFMEAIREVDGQEGMSPESAHAAIFVVDYSTEVDEDTNKSSRMLRIYSQLATAFDEVSAVLVAATAIRYLLERDVLDTYKLRMAVDELLVPVLTELHSRMHADDSDERRVLQ